MRPLGPGHPFSGPNRGGVRPPHQLAQTVHGARVPHVASAPGVGSGGVRWAGPPAGQSEAANVQAAPARRRPDPQGGVRSPAPLLRPGAVAGQGRRVGGPCESPRLQGSASTPCATATDPGSPIRDDQSATTAQPEVDIQTRVSRVSRLWVDARTAVEQEREELGHTLKTLQTSYNRAQELEQLLARCRRTTQQRAGMLDETRAELVLHMGDDLEHESEERLEEVAENLQRALQKVTIAEASKQYRMEASPKAMDSDESDEVEPSSLTVPQCPPAAHHTPALSFLAELRDELDALYEQQREEHERKVQHGNRLAEMQGQISRNIAEYGVARERLSEVKRVHREARTQLAQLKGTSSLSAVSVEQLSQLGADIGKYSRKVLLATAVRQVRKEQSAGLHEPRAAAWPPSAGPPRGNGDPTRRAGSYTSGPPRR